jgi:hypothetical protein
MGLPVSVIEVVRKTRSAIFVVILNDCVYTSVTLCTLVQAQVNALTGIKYVYMCGLYLCVSLCVHMRVCLCVCKSELGDKYVWLERKCREGRV